MTKSDDLKLARVKTFQGIPEYLLEQVKDRNWEPDKLKQWGELVANDPFQFIYLMVTPQHEVKGFVWASAAPLVNGIFINVISVDSEYQDHIILKKVTGFFKSMLEEMGLKHLYAITGRPKAAERKGWKRMGMEMMEV